MRLSGPGLVLGVPVLGGLFTLVTAVILARVGGRLLGIRLRWRRAILAGFPGLMLGWIAAWSINGQRHGPQKLPWPAVLVGALVATMLIAVLLDLLARPGQDHGGDQGEQPAEHRDTPQQARSAQSHRPSPRSAVGLHEVRNHRVFPPSVTPPIPASPTLGTSRLVGHRSAGHNPGGLVCRQAHPPPSWRRTGPGARVAGRGRRGQCVSGCLA